MTERETVRDKLMALGCQRQINKQLTGMLT